MLGDEFARKDSFLYSIDPRVKIILACLFSVFLAMVNTFSVLLLAFVFGLAIVVGARLNTRSVLRRLIPVNLFILFLWIFLPFTFKGEPLFYVGPLTASHEGVLQAARISIKSNAIMLVLISLVSSTSVFTLGHALHDIRVPEKIVHLFFFTFRYIHVIQREYATLVNALKIRGFRPKTNIHTYKTFAYLVGMLIVRSSDRAQRVHNAMLCRGFRGRLYSLSRFSINRADVVSLALTLTFLVGLGILEWTRIV